MMAGLTYRPKSGLKKLFIFKRIQCPMASIFPSISGLRRIDPNVDWTRWGQRQVQDCDLVMTSDAWRKRREGLPPCPQRCPLVCLAKSVTFVGSDCSSLEFKAYMGYSLI